uniref:AAA+ ATPase domain-containing protein n=1 Tax=Spongospora subterranea TaxID=70186 RepID=A0A0H5RB29_9EUKA|eukprot:CRZ10817.1 hypothetical protein [Spongospora subterranea]
MKQSSIKSYFGAKKSNESKTEVDRVKDSPNNHDCVLISDDDNGAVTIPITSSPLLLPTRTTAPLRPPTRSSPAPLSMPPPDTRFTNGPDNKAPVEKMVNDYISSISGRQLCDYVPSLSPAHIAKGLCRGLSTANGPRRSQLWSKTFSDIRVPGDRVDKMMKAWVGMFTTPDPDRVDPDIMDQLDDIKVVNSDDRGRQQDWIVDDSDSDIDQESQRICPVMILEGATGTGKTSSVHASLAALNNNHHGVLEINTSQRRRYADIMKQFKEATQSHWIDHINISADKSCAKTKNLKKQKRTKKSKMVTDNKKHSVILIDDVDIELEDDMGFHRGIISLSKHTRQPIVLTCASLPDHIRSGLSNGYYSLEMAQPHDATLSSHLILICIAMAAVSLPSSTDLLRCLAYSHYDIRSVLNHLQFWLPTRPDLMFSITKDLVYSCLSSPRTDLYPHIAGLTNIPVNYLISSPRHADRARLAHHFIDIERPDTLHSHYLTLMDKEDDARSVHNMQSLSSVADGLSISDVLSRPFDRFVDLAVHHDACSLRSWIISASMLSNQNSDHLHHLSLHCSLPSPDTTSLTELWSQLTPSHPLSKQHPSSQSFITDTVSALRIISNEDKKKEDQYESGRLKRRRFQAYLENRVATSGVEWLKQQQWTSTTIDT